MSPSFATCVFFVIEIKYFASAVTSVTNCPDPPNEVEAVDGQVHFLSFMLPNKYGDSYFCKVSSPFGLSYVGKGKNKNGYTYGRSDDGIIESFLETTLDYPNEKCEKINMSLQKFDSLYAGSWEVLRKYDKQYDRTGGLPVPLQTYDYINVYIVKFDKSLHGRRVDVQIGEYIVMYMNAKSNYTVCELRHNGMNMTYDLKEYSYRFPNKGAAIQRIGSCGFRMRVENLNDGEWMLAGHLGWTRQRAIFQININSTINRVQTSLVAIPNPFNEDFPNALQLLPSKHRSAYWELERPDGYIIQSSSMLPKDSNFGALDTAEDIAVLGQITSDDSNHESLNTAETIVALGQTTSDDEGLWKVRVGYRNDSYLREEEIYISVVDSPNLRYSLEKFFDSRYGESFILLTATLEMYKAPRACSFRSTNGNISELSNLSNVVSYPFPLPTCSHEFRNTGGHIDSGKWEVSFDYQDSKVIGSFTIESGIHGIYEVSPSYSWYKVRPRKYVKRGEEMKVKCAVNHPLAECVLESKNGTRYIYGDSSFLTGKKCTERGRSMEGNCGCIMAIPNANEWDNGNWTCHMKLETGSIINSIIQVLVTESYLISEVERKNNTVKLVCRTYPTMYYDEIGNCEWSHPKEGRIIFANSTLYSATREDDVCILQLEDPSVNDIGEWMCFAHLNYKGEVNATIDLLQISTNASGEQKTDTPLVNTSPKFARTIIFSLLAFLLISIGIITLLFYLHNRNKKIHEMKIKEAQVERKIFFENTDHSQWNLKDFLHNEADSLPYDEERWEYPIQELKSVKKLGEGEYGIVEKHKAPNIMKDGNYEGPMVAVKKVSYPDIDHLRALAFELKICSNLGYHTNVVNFLGGCTKNVSEYNLRVIFEFCQLGSLKKYIFKHKSEFVDQIDSMVSGVVNMSSCEYFRLNYAQQNNESSSRRSLDETSPGASPKGSTSRKSSNKSSPRNSSDRWSVKTASLSDISIDSDEYPDHIRNIPKNFSTGDLLIWASEISKGMEYLSEKKIVHGDLAIRNVLLTEARVAKISDFGLSRFIPDGYYRNQRNIELPFMSMPIESLRERKFSTYSDVWSFGILLWECFTLGDNPYSALSVAGNPPKLLALLGTGYRLEKPLYAPEELYNLMRLCWNKEPEERPSFNHLSLEIGRMLNKNNES